VPGRLASTTVAIDSNDVLGFVTVHGDEVEQLYVTAQARGGGGAAMLLQHAEDEIASCAGTAWLAVVAGNSRARRFYERQGWRNAGPFDYLADIDDGTIAVPCLRYEKPL
jgi:GNAT superfamily N-acetyltransferase